MVQLPVSRQTALEGEAASTTASIVYNFCTVLPRTQRIAEIIFGLFLTGACVPAHAQPTSAPSRRAPARPPETLIIQGLGRGVVPLGGLWQFKTGDNPAWASPDFDDSTWQRLRVDDTRGYGDQGHFDYHGYAWYRRHIDIRPTPGASNRVAIIVFAINSGDGSESGPYEIYWNGVLIGREGKLPPHPSWRFRPPAHSFGLGNATSGVLAVRTWKMPPTFIDSGYNGGFHRAPLIGSPQAVIAQLGVLDHAWLRDRQFYFDENLLYAILGVLGFVAWLCDRSLKVLFCMAVYALIQAGHVLLFNAHIGLSSQFTLGFDLVVENIASVALWYLLLYLLELDRQARLMRWVRALSAFLISASLLDWFLISRDWSTPLAPVYQAADAILSIPINLVALIPLALILIACLLRRRIGVANWLVAITASLYELIGVVRLCSIQGSRFTHLDYVYYFIQQHLFTIHGNYFDMQAVADTLLLIAILFAVFRYSADQSERKGALEQEFKSARELQRILIPDSLPPLTGLAVTSSYVPAHDVGGDFFQVIAQPDASALIVLGDVSGKGLKAALTVSLLVGAVRTLAEQSGDPASILAGLNRRLEGRLQHGFATCIVLRIDPSGACTAANAGHLLPFLNRSELALPPALPLGLIADAAYQNIAFQFAPGARLTLYTDGLLEARNAAKELYGFDRVRDLIEKHPDAHTATQAAIAFGQEDDITVLTITRIAPGVESAPFTLDPDLANA